MFINHKFILIALCIFKPLLAEASDTLCNKGEKDLFLCFSNQKTVSFCMAKLDDNTVELEYRYGRVGSVEMIYPLKDGDSFSLSTNPMPGGLASRIHFLNGGYEYIIYDYQSNNPSSGLLVRKQGKVLKQIKCENDAFLKAEVFDVIDRDRFGEDIVIPE